MKTPILILCFSAALCARGAWYWPFGTDEDSTNAPPRLHRLLQPANDFIELAQDASLEGDAEKALENYRLALAELDRVEVENPDRAASAEFAPLRLRRAACTAAIDAIRFAQVNENVRPVSVTDTTDLQRRWDKDHGIVGEEEEGKKPAAPPSRDEAKPTPPAKVAAKPKEEPAPKATAKPHPPATLPTDWNGRFARAIAYLRAQDYAAADVLLESMLRERPKDLNALLLRAAAQAGTQSYNAAQRTLERAMRAHPRSYLPYYNLANLLIQQGSDLEAAREYYDLGRTVGGPVNKALEARLKGVVK